MAALGASASAIMDGRALTNKSIPHAHRDLLSHSCIHWEGKAKTQKLVKSIQCTKSLV
jgi:hypothetical protein